MTSQEREVTANVIYQRAVTCLFIVKDAIFLKLQFIDFPDILIGILHAKITFNIIKGENHL